MFLSLINTLNGVKSTLINTIIILIIGVGIGGGSVIWLLQANMNGVCNVLSARNQFINLVQKDSK